MSQIGQNLRISIFGQSHSEAIGVTIEGLPVGESIDIDELEKFLARRAPGQALTTTRKESDCPEIICGLFRGKTCGAPLTAIIRNKDMRSKDYDAIADTPRPSHADLTADIKYHGYQDFRGGGAFSGRLTAPIAIAGGIAMQILARRGINIGAHILTLGDIQDQSFPTNGIDSITLSTRLNRSLPVLSDDVAQQMQDLVLRTRKEGDSIGGIIECIAQGMPAGFGGPIFDGIDGKLALALFGIPGVKGVSFGAGFDVANMKGSINNDPYEMTPLGINTKENNAGGILGGITTGAPILFKVAMKPTPSIALPQESISISKKENVTLRVTGRHDPCIVIRAVPVVEAVAAITLLDQLLSAPTILSNTPIA